MSGFDALGRLAIGQAANASVVNPILTADAGAFALAGIPGTFKTVQSSSTGGYAFTANDAFLNLTMRSVAASYAVSGSTALFGINLPGSNASYLLSGNGAFLGAGGFQATTGIFAMSGVAVTFSISVSGSAVSEPGVFMITGNPISFGLDRNAWIDRSFEIDTWTARAEQTETWTPAAIQSETWTAE